MDFENQASIKRLVEAHGKENLIAVLGAKDPSTIETMGVTLTKGDPSYAGPLGGVELDLPFYHIFEPAFEAIIPEALYQEKLEFPKLSTDLDSLFGAIEKVRSLSAG
jgi:glycine reductase